MNVTSIRGMGFAAMAAAMLMSACAGAATPAPQPTSAPAATTQSGAATSQPRLTSTRVTASTIGGDS